MTKCGRKAARSNRRGCEPAAANKRLRGLCPCRCKVRSSFSGADLCPNEEEDAGTPLWLFKDDDEVRAQSRPIKPARA